MVSLKQARQHLSQLVDAAQRGESTVITRRGKRAAQLAPIESEKRPHLPDLSGFRASLTISGEGLSETVVALRNAEPR